MHPSHSIVEAIAIQELEGIIPRASRFELEAKQVFVVIVLQSIEQLMIIEELFEYPKLAEIEENDMLAFGNYPKVLHIVSHIHSSINTKLLRATVLRGDNHR